MSASHMFFFHKQLFDDPTCLRQAVVLVNQMLIRLPLQHLPAAADILQTNSSEEHFTRQV